MKFMMWLKELHFSVMHIRLNDQNKSHKTPKLLGFQAEIDIKGQSVIIFFFHINKNFKSRMQKSLPSSLTEVRKNILKVLQLLCFVFKQDAKERIY